AGDIPEAAMSRDIAQRRELASASAPARERGEPPMPMLSQPEPTAATVPPVAEVLELMSEYLDTLMRVEMLAECLTPPPAAVVSLSRRQALSASHSARDQLECARDALAMAGNFTRAVPLGAGFRRPVDLTRGALERLE